MSKLLALSKCIENLYILDSVEAEYNLLPLSRKIRIHHTFDIVWIGYPRSPYGSYLFFRLTLILSLLLIYS